MPAEPAADTCAPASKWALFSVFNRMSLQGFGGVLPIAQRELVERERWLTRAEFLELLSVGQVLPGPNVVNVALMFGDRHFGLRGALAALAGMLLAPLVIVLLLAALYAHFASVPMVAGALRGMGAVAAGLVLSTALKLAPALQANVLGRPRGLAVAALTFAVISGLHAPLLWAVAGIGLPSCALAWWLLRDWLLD
jgi:chromate transporter